MIYLLISKTIDYYVILLYNIKCYLLISIINGGKTMHIIVRTVSDYPNRFQKKIDELVNELCNENGYRITTISNLVQSDLGVVTSLSNDDK